MTIAAAIITYTITRIVESSLKRATKGRVKKHFRESAFRIFQIIIWIVALFVILGIWGINLTGLLAGAGFMGIVVGLAAQETLGNIISGLVMMFSRPFEIGEWVEIAGYSGEVEEITIIYTKLKTFDGEIVALPNKLVSTKEINNKSRVGEIRVKETIGVDYEADPSKAGEIAEEELKNHELILEDPEPKAFIEELGDSSVNITLLFWIGEPLPGNRRKVLNDLIASIKKRYEEEGIGIPFPHRELLQHEGEGWEFSERTSEKD